MTQPTQATQKAALITGATGFVGRHLTRHLSTLGWRTHALVRPESAGVDLPAENVHVYDGSSESIHQALINSNPDVVFHLATHFVAEHAPGEIDAMIESNIRFGAHLLQAMQTTGITALVNTGTSWQNFNDADYRPVNFYAATKQAFEDILTYYADAENLTAVTLRLFDTYGPNDARKKLFWALQNAAQGGNTLSMSPGQQKIDLVHVDDVVRACEIAARLVMSEKGSGHDIFAVSGLNPQPLKTIVETFESVLGKPINVEWGGRPYREREVMKPWSTGIQLPGWKPEILLKEGIANMLNRHV